MKATIVSQHGTVMLRDEDQRRDVVAFTATEAMWVAQFLQHHTTSELVVKLRLAAQHAEQQILNAHPERKEFNPHA